VVVAFLAVALAPVTMLEVTRGAGLAPPSHLVVSEVVTGGASASDELIELHNPTASALPLEGLEVIYVTSTGATITRRAAWEVGAPSVPAGGHVLIANASGIYASVADATYASGMAATSGSVAIRILGATTAVDAVGWGATTSSWREGAPAAAPATGASVERLPGGALGSGTDSDDNAADFAQRLVPEPQNLASAPTPDPAAPTQPPAPSPTPGEPPITPAPTPIPTATPLLPPVTPIGTARAAPDGTTVTIEAVALTSSDFHDGGGYVADVTGGIAVLLTDGSFGPGELVRVTGDIDDRFSQRTLRADAGSLVSLGTASEPSPVGTSTGAIGESLEGQLVHIVSSVVGSPTELSSGLAIDVDDGSGATRVVVGTATGIDAASWASGTTLDLVGVAGQRDSSGSGTDGYRVLPRQLGDVIAVATPGSPPPEQSPGAEIVTPIAQARAAAKNAQLRIRGVVTLPTGLLDEHTAVVQDGTGAIILRLGPNAGQLRLGARIEVAGKRSTLSGMETLRATESVARLGTGPEPAMKSIRTGDAGDADEAKLVLVTGAIVASARRSSSGSISFEIDDGSGPLRVSLASRLRADRAPLSSGTWVEVRGVLGQETSLSKPNEGYRVWPRAASEVRVTAPAGGALAGGSGSISGGGESGGPADGPTGSLDDLGTADLSRLRIGATLVVGPWEELRIGGLLWDGARLVAIHPSSASLVARLARERRLPIALDLGGLRAVGSNPDLAVPVVRLGPAAGQTTTLDGVPAAPRTEVAGDLPAWVSVVGRLSGPAARRVLVVDGERVVILDRCEDDDDRPRDGAVSVTGVAIGEPLRLLVPCGGVQTAPNVAARTTIASLGSRAVAPGRELETAALPVEPDLRRAIVAGLLVAAAIALIGGALLGRRRSPDPDASIGEADLSESTDAAPALTLVPVPRESGP